MQRLTQDVANMRRDRLVGELTLAIRILATRLMVAVGGEAEDWKAMASL